MYKKCGKCEETKYIDEFYKLTKSITGAQQYCKECQNRDYKKARARRIANGPTIIRTSKECQKCHNIKPIGQFGTRSDSADGKLSYCKPCWTDYVKKAKKKTNK